MFTARKKIVKEKGAEPDDFEESVAQVRRNTQLMDLSTSSAASLLYWASSTAAASCEQSTDSSSQCQAAAAPCLQALFDLEATNNELKSDLRDLYITAAKEIDVAGSRKAIIVHVSSVALPQELASLGHTRS